MIDPREILQLIGQAESGNVPPEGNLEQAEEVLGFSFGLYFNGSGQLARPGPINDAIASRIVNDEVLRTKNMVLQEELARAVEAREPRLSLQIATLPTIKAPFQTYNTHELLMVARHDFMSRGVGHLAVVAFRHHLPRAAAQVKKAGFAVSTPDMRGVGEFDATSGQAWIRSKDAWIQRERLVIGAFALLNRI